MKGSTLLITGSPGDEFRRGGVIATITVRTHTANGGNRVFRPGENL